MTELDYMELLKQIFICVVLVLILRWAFVEPYKIPSGSMKPALTEGDRIFVNKFRYGLRVPFTDKRIWRGAEPQRWDIAVFHSVEEDADHKILVKRVIGLPGEHIQVRNGTIYVNGEPVMPPPPLANARYTQSGRYGVLPADEFARVPEDHYLLLGDNSGQSRDGRVFGWVPNENLLGRAFCIWWPLARRSDITGFTKTWWWKISLSLVALLVLGRMFHGFSVRTDLGEARRAHIYINQLVFGLPVPFTSLRLTQGRLPVRGETVLYEAPKNSDRGGHLLLGKVMALPTERLEVEGGKVRLNGALVKAPALLDGDGAESGAASLAVPPEHFFILSDDGEPDSASLGWIPRRNVIGAATVIWWPPWRWERLRP